MKTRAFAPRAGLSLLAALSAITLNACSQEPESSAKTQPGSWRDGIFIEGVSLQEAYAKRKFKYEEFDAAAKRFPTVEACLVSDPKKAASLTVDWYKISSDVESAVCLTRVANKIGTARGVIGWLRAHGFIVNLVRRAEYYETHSSVRLEGFKVHSYWPLKKKGPLYRGGINLFIPWTISHSISVDVFFGSSSKVICVSTITNTL